MIFTILDHLGDDEPYIHCDPPPVTSAQWMEVFDKCSLVCPARLNAWMRNWATNGTHYVMDWAYGGNKLTLDQRNGCVAAMEEFTERSKRHEKLHIQVADMDCGSGVGRRATGRPHS